jgi:hypothetical protein
MFHLGRSPVHEHARGGLVNNELCAYIRTARLGLKVLGNSDCNKYFNLYQLAVMQ